MTMIKRSDIVINQGATFKQRYLYKDSAGDPIDLTGYTAVAQLRQTHDAEEALIDFDVDLSDAADGIIQISLHYDDTAELVAPNTAYYDILITSPDDERDRFIEGKAVVTPRASAVS